MSPILALPAGRIRLCRFSAFETSVGGKLLGVERLGIEVHHDLAELAAERQRHRGALHRGELGANEVQAQIEDLLLAEGLALEAHLQNGNARGVVFDDAGREGPGRKDAQQRLADGGDLRHGHFDVHVGLEVDARDGDAAVRLRLDVFDIVHRRRHGALEDGVDAFLHLVRRNAGVVPDDADDGDIDVRKDVHRHCGNGDSAEDGNEHRHHHEGVGPAKG